MNTDDRMDYGREADDGPKAAYHEAGSMTDLLAMMKAGAL